MVDGDGIEKLLLKERFAFPRHAHLMNNLERAECEEFQPRGAKLKDEASMWCTVGTKHLTVLLSHF